MTLNYYDFSFKYSLISDASEMVIPIIILHVHIVMIALYMFNRYTYNRTCIVQYVYISRPMCLSCDQYKKVGTAVVLRFRLQSIP